MSWGEHVSDERAGAALRVLIGAWLRTHPSEAVAVRDLAMAIVQEANAAAGLAETAPIIEPAVDPMPVPADIAVSRLSPEAPTSARIVDRPPAPLSSGFVPLKIGDVLAQIQVRGTSDEIARARGSACEAPDRETREFRQVDLSLIVRRSTLKAEACSVAVTRRAAVDTAEEAAQVARVNGLLQRAKQLDSCFLWMLFPDREQPGDADLLQTRECYENLARACKVAQGTDGETGPDRRHSSLALLAEAQSALRAQLERTWLTRPDQCQEDAFQFLDETTTSEGIYVERHMRRSDPADPNAWADLRARLEERLSADAVRESELKRAKTFLDKISFHARGAASAPDERDHHLRRIEDAISGLGALAIAPEDRRVRERLQSIARIAVDVGELPLLARAVNCTTENRSSESRTRAFSSAVMRVRDMLRGSVLVIVGGERRQDAVDRLVEAFEIRGVEWIVLNEHTTAAPLHAPIARADVLVVAVLIKLTGHQHSDEAAAAARIAGKALVRIPAGYSPEQIAAQILEQASDRLSAPVAAK